LLATDFGKEPSDSTFRLLLSQLDVAGFERWCRQPAAKLADPAVVGLLVSGQHPESLSHQDCADRSW
jgi:hypothetical protein